MHYKIELDNLINKISDENIKELKSIVDFLNGNYIETINMFTYDSVLKNHINVFLETNLYRHRVLVFSYFKELEIYNSLGCNIILRSIFENVAAIVYFHKKIFEVLKDDCDFDKLEEILDKLVISDKGNINAVNPVNVLTTTKTMDKYYLDNFNIKSNFYSYYNFLCDIFHPNFGGYDLIIENKERGTILLKQHNEEISEEHYRITLFIQVNKLYKLVFGFFQILIKENIF